MPAVQFASQAYQARSTQLIAQQCINAFVETSPKDAKTPVPVYGTPGLTPFAYVGAGPINGLWVMGSLLYALSRGVLYSIEAPTTIGGLATPTLIGPTNLGGIVSMADNGFQLVMVDGSAGWIYQPGGLNQITTVTATAGATSISANITGTISEGDVLNIALDNGATFTTNASAGADAESGIIYLATPLPSQVTAGAIIIDPAVTLAQILAPAFASSNSVTYMDGYFVFNALGTRQFFLSGIDDGTQYSGLDFATATANTGFVMAVSNFHEQLMIFTSKASTEVWYDSGAATFPFQRYDGVYLQRGIGGSLSLVNEDNTVFWMGEDGIFYRNEGFLPKRISTFAMEHAWANYPLKFSDCNAFVLDQEGHKFIVLQFPSGQQTWVYDITTGLWHQRASMGNPWIAGPTPSGGSTTPQIAQLQIPSDGFGLPQSLVMDWARHFIYVRCQYGCRVYALELVTQEPIVSATNGGYNSGTGADIDPVTATLIVSGSVSSDYAQVLQYAPGTLDQIGVFGNSGSFLLPPYPANVGGSSLIVCAGCGTEASSGTAQVGYAFVMQFVSIVRGYVSVIRTDTMAAAGFNSNVTNSATNVMCRGQSGASGASVFVAPSGSPVSSFILSEVAVVPGAENYDISSWPTANPGIASFPIGTIAATAVDASATTLQLNAIGYDAIDGFVVADITTNGTLATDHFLTGIDAALGVIRWISPYPGGNNTLNLSRINAGFADYLSSSHGYNVGTSNGAVNSSILNGVTAVAPTGSLPLIMASDDESRLVVTYCNYVEGSGTPTPVTNTPTAFSGSMAVAGFWGTPWY